MLWLDRGVLGSVREHCAGAHPEEACGLLVGSVRGQERRALRAVRARNARSDRPGDRFELDPADFVAADAAARDAGLEIVGVYHSHPDGPATPSEIDHAVAEPGWAHLIVSVGGRPVRALEERAWVLAGPPHGRRLVPEALRVAPPRRAGH